MAASGAVNRILASILASVSYLGAADWLVLYNSGVEKFGRGSLGEASRDLKTALDSAEAARLPGVQRAEILHVLGRVEFQLGRLHPAISYHQRALGLLPPEGRTADLFKVAQAYRELEDYRTAERYAREALALSREDPRILELLASVLIQRRKYPEAESAAQRALTKGDPTVSAIVWTDLAIIEEARGRFSSAAELLERAVAQMAPSHARARTLSNLSLMENRLKRYRESLIHARQAVTELETHAGPQHPDMCKTLQRYADALSDSGQKVEAMQIAQRARQLQSLLGATVDWRSAKE